jgi:hypothetical protein
MKKLIIGVVSVAVLAFCLVSAEAATDARAHRKNTMLRPPCAPECELDANHSMLKVRRIIAIEAVLRPIWGSTPRPRPAGSTAWLASVRNGAMPKGVPPKRFNTHRNKFGQPARPG